MHLAVRAVLSLPQPPSGRPRMRGAAPESSHSRTGAQPMPGVAACENAGSGKVARAMPLQRDTSLSREGGLLVCGGGRLFRGLDNALLLYEPGAQARDGRGAKVESNAVGHVALRQPNAGGTPSELLIHTALRDRPCCICRFVLWFLGSNT